MTNSTETQYDKKCIEQLEAINKEIAEIIKLMKGE